MLSRRSLLKIASALVVLPAGGVLLYRLRSFELPVRPLSPEERQAVRTVTDLIVPADEISPGAIDLKIDAEILGRANENRYFRRVLKRGVSWLNSEAVRSTGREFLFLGQREQVDLLKNAEAADSESPENRFFRRMRDLTLKLYYTRPLAWQVLCYQGPPQPLGFIDYEKPPRECSSSA